jgi:hypothetical protein
MAKYSKNIEDIKSAVKENQLVCDKNNAYYITYNRDQDKFFIICRSNNYTIGLSHIDKKTNKEKINMGEPKGYWLIHTIDETWAMRIAKYLEGRTIVRVDYCSEKEMEHQGWHNQPIQILLDNGTWLTPTSDDEGNNGGAIHTNIKELPVIPVI